MSPLLSQTIRLIKSIRLRSSDSSKRPSSQFIAGKHPPFGFPTGVGLNWWYSTDTFAAQESMATLLIRDSPEFRDCDLETVFEVIRKTLHEICIDQAVFNADDVVFARKSTLFDCINVPVTQCAASVLGAVQHNLRAQIGRCCTIYAVSRFRPESFYLEEVKIHVIPKQDQLAWQRLTDEGFLFDGWTPKVPRVGMRNDSIYSPDGEYECILVADGHGTKQGTRFSRSYLKIV